MSATLEQLEGMTEDAYKHGKAAGYAEAVADIRQVAADMMGRIYAPYLANLMLILDSGAHVGAAKKGATNG